MYGLSTEKKAVVERWPLVAWRFDCNVLFGNTVIERKEILS